jgi:RNA polymerase sigma-54 factor
MTPQLQQAIKLLQLGRMEYLEVIGQELLENPVLEDVRESGEEPSASETQNYEAPAVDPQPQEQASRSESSDEQSSPGELYDYGSSKSYRGDTDRERPSLEATLSSPEGLDSHLLWQMRTSDIPQRDIEIAAQILGNLDRNGYLCATVEEIAQLSSCSIDDVNRVLSFVQTLEPAGIAARDLRECLLIQLDQLGLVDTLAGRVVDHHLADLEVRRYDVIAKAEGVELEEVYESVKLIQKLEPRPGRPFVDEAPIYITPDVYVRKVGDEYHLSLNEAGMPRLRLNPEYQQLAQKGVQGSGSEKEYLQDRIKSAAWLIKSIEQRQQTIFRVTESIMKHQRDFLEHGVSQLKPLILREIAGDVGMHESTVSRVTTNKYVHTPQGVFELKFFFSSGLKSGTGEVSSESVKEQIRALVAAENPKKPMSDQAIVNSLKKEGVDIARRTVAKYREMMGILSSSRRKRVF